MTLETQKGAAAPARGGQALRLDIAGSNLLIAGTFEQWVPLVMEGLRDDRAVQLLVDLTSSKGTAEAAAVNDNKLLFSFEGHDIKRMPVGHRVRGTLTLGTQSAPAEVLLQAPAAHTPFAVLAFEVPEGFETMWDEMSKRADDNAARGETEVRAWGWLRPPAVAAA